MCRLERAKRLNPDIVSLTDVQIRCMELLEDGRNICIRLPTGAGKTVIFMVPFVEAPVPTLVIIIVPLIALLHDQLRKLVNRVHIIDGHQWLLRRIQADRKKKISNAKFTPDPVGKTESVPVPDVDRGKTDFRNV